MERSFFIIVILFLIIHYSQASVSNNNQCSGTTFTGGNNSYDSSGPDNNTAFSYVVEDKEYAFGCCGRITKWEGTTGKSGLLQLQVWRKLSKDSYIMIGENAVNVDVTGPFNFEVPAADQIVVNKGDFIGWHNQGDEMLKYEMEAKTSGNYATMFRRINTGDLHTGDIYNWSNVEAYNDRRYALRATTKPSTAPTVTLTSDVTIPDYIQSGATVSKVTWSDAETGDNSTLTVYFQKALGYLGMDFPSPAGTGSGYLTATNTNNFRPRPDTLTYFVYDQCFHTATVTQNITVQETDLIINNAPATVTVNETGIESQLLHTITVTEPTDQWYCKSNWSTGIPFILKAITMSSYGFYKVEHALLDYDSRSNYSNLPFECVENRVSSTNTATSTISVYINKNQPPTLTNLDASIIVNANQSHKGDTLFYVNATDPEGDDLTYNATYNWQHSTLLLTNNGALQVLNWLVPNQNLSYTLYVTVTDTAGNTDTGYLSVSLINTDYPVSIRTTPNSPMQVKENTAIYTLFYQFQYDDLDQYDTKTYSLAFDNDKLTNYFSIDFATGDFRTSFVELDFEELSSVFTYTATIMVGDQKGSATTTFTVEIINENETPRFTKDYFVLEANEGADGDVLEAGGLFTADMKDQDLSETVNAEIHEYILNCSAETHRFYMNSASGQIVYRGPYDIDVSGTPTDVDCQITVLDKYGLTATAGLYVHVKNVNEFSPEFTQSNYSAYVATNTLIGKHLLTVSAIDHDNSDDDDNEITYSVDQSDPVGGLMLIDISHTGIIYTTGSFAIYTAGAIIGPIILQASNYGVPDRTGTASIYLVVPEFTTTVTTTTDRHYEFYEDHRNYMWLILSVAAIGVVILILSLVLFRVCHLARIRPWCYACCMRGICCRPKKEGPRGFGDKGYDLASFGHKQQYADEEIDGWLKTDDRKYKRSWTSKREADDMDGWLRRVEETPSYRQPFNDDAHEGSDARYDDQPLYEMFRIPDNVPAKASYDDPRTRWKKRSSKRQY